MQEHHQDLCDELVDYLTGDISAGGRRPFDNHLSGCPSCKQELEELNEVWVAIPLLTEEIELPDDLRDQVMRGIFGEEQVPLPTERNRNENRLHTRRPKRIRAFFAATVTAAAVVSMLVFVLNPQMAPKLQDTNQATLGTAQIVKTYSLKSADPTMPQARGNAWITELDGRNQIIVQLHGVLPTSGNGVYQVWLVRDRDRFNCGTLVVNDQGDGILTYYINKENMGFEEIGVTLEPDANGTQPRGKQVLST